MLTHFQFNQATAYGTALSQLLAELGIHIERAGDVDRRLLHLQCGPPSPAPLTPSPSSLKGRHGVSTWGSLKKAWDSDLESWGGWGTEDWGGLKEWEGGVRQA